MTYNFLNWQLAVKFAVRAAKATGLRHSVSSRPMHDSRIPRALRIYTVSEVQP